MLNWLKHAFAVQSGGEEPTLEQRAAVERVCREIVRRHLTTPALIFLELFRPLNYLAAQALYFFSPFIGVLTDAEWHRHFASFLERRSAIEFLCRRIEELEAAAQGNVTDGANDRDDGP